MSHDDHPLSYILHPDVARRLALKRHQADPPQRTMAFLEDGRLIEPLVGWRAWRLCVTDGKPTLTSVAWHGRARWVPGINTAVCLGPPDAPVHQVPGPNALCDCGLYAYRDPKYVVTRFNPRSYVLGEVQLWGKVRVHEQGMRASVGRIVALWAPQEGVGGAQRAHRLIVDLAASTYEVPIVKAPEEAYKIIQAA